jgi:hypothetical protein
MVAPGQADRSSLRPSSKVEVQAIGAVLGAAPIAERAPPTRPGGACAPSGPKEKKGPDGATAQ